MKRIERRSALRAMKDGELADELIRLRREQFNLRMQSATGQSARPSEFGKVRTDIARIKTLLRERELADKAQGAGKDQA